ncbi:c-type cytochrome [Dyella sp. 2RAB6]|uniref:c-type cytochrome n=1 Tax=Dyella sp. 2RAB6 TaxID=3232992 RepID=UPI003F8F8670
MCSRFLEGALGLALCALLLGGCEREQRDFTGPQPDTSGPAPSLADLQPGSLTAQPRDPRGAIYENNAYHIGQGQNLFRWMNCSGCHANGGGDSGPALMDDEWRYGGDIDHIFASIDQGRPNGMPSFRGKLPPEQIWELAAYVRTLSDNVRKDAVPSRKEGLSTTPPLTQKEPEPPKSTDAASTQDPQK